MQEESANLPSAEEFFTEDASDTSEVEDTHHTEQDETGSEDSQNDSQEEVGHQEQQNQEDGEDSGDEDEEREHNRANAERRIAERQRQQQANDQFISQLRERAHKEYLPEIDEKKYEEIAYEDGDRAAENQRRLDEIERRETERQLEAEMQQVEHFQSQIGMQMAQASSSIPLFNPKSDEYNEQISNEVHRAWAREHAIMTQDEQGNVHILGQKPNSPSIHEYLSQKAQFYEGIIRSASLKGQTNASKTAGRADFRVKDSNSSSSSDDTNEFVSNFFK